MSAQPHIRILRGDALAVLPTLPAESAQVCVTSPPYYGLRQYIEPGHPDYQKQIGLEPTFDCLGWAREPRCGECFICRLTSVFAEVRRVLRRDGTLWLNIGDSYANPDKGGYQNGRIRGDSKQASNLASDFVGAPDGMRNWRDVWPIGPEPYKEAHFATFPSEIPRRAIIAGSRAGDVVLDPFAGSGTTGRVAVIFEEQR